MPEIGAGDDDPDYAERIAGNADVHKGAWQRTLEDMEAMADELEAEGWDVLTVASGHTAPTNPDAGETDRFGFVHVVPGNEAEEFAEMVDTGKFPQYRVFRNEMQGRAFMVTQLLDPDTEQTILIAGSFELRHAPGMVKTALEEGEMYTHVQKLDQTHLGSFRHDDVEKFFPEPHRYEELADWDVGIDEASGEAGDE